MRLTANRVAFDGRPDWSPSGTRIAFVSDRSGNTDIWVMKLMLENSTNSPKNLTRNPASEDYPAYSPDGRKIAFASNRNGGSFDVFKMRADSTQQTRVTNTTNIAESDPSWQPDP